MTLDPETIISKYQERIIRTENELRDIRKKVKLFSWLRLLIFTGITLLLYFYFTLDSPAGLLLLTIAFTAGFLYIVRRHSEIRYRQTVHEKILEINHNEIAVCKREASFLHDGTSFHKPLSYTEDLDIFGPLSLFHTINRCFSEPGRKKLARWLVSPTFDQNMIWKRQRANMSVKEMIDTRQLFLAHGLVHFDDAQKHFSPEKKWIERSTIRKYRLFRWILPALMLVFVLAAFYTSDSNMILYGFILNLILTGFFLKTTLGLLQKSEYTLKNLKNYHRPLEVLIRQEYTRTSLKEKKIRLQKIYKELRSLQRRYELLESRNNVFAGLLLNGFIGYDFWAVCHLHDWHDAHSVDIPVWLDEIAFFEALFSISTFAYNNPSYTIPRLERETGISGRNIRHPFIPEKMNVGNPLEFVPPLKVILLTGSNMSGKSTFLRALGVNQILAMAGSVVAADEFDTGLYEIFSSFRKSDSIHEHTSLFYDELKKLKHIITELERVKLPALILLDEILRGTNSDDKFYGSRQILLRLKDKNALTMLATHDIALASLEEEHPESIRNYSFESQIVNGELNFDYTLHQGVAVNKNATFLMEKMGII